ncbi:MAG TPA: class I SAM-dependent methyltransferase [Vicinamibacterales bacterium]|nr:class I SAM-dependent methyltransferase [Vicinamibacterales bacterium]
MTRHAHGASKTVAKVRDDFDHVARIAEEFDAGGDGAAEPHERYLLRHLPDPCETVLELGCGTGEFSRRLAARARKVVALDLSAEMIRVARSRSAGRGNIEFLVGDMTTLPLRRETFDCVTSLNTLHHVDPVRALRAMRAVLRPDRGRLLVADVLDRPGLRSLPINAVAKIVRLVRSVTVERRTQRRALRRAYVKHGCGEAHPTLAEARALVASELPGAVVRGHLLWRYTVVWRAGEGERVR